MITRRTLLVRLGMVAALGCFNSVSIAQSTQPLTIVVGFPAGVVTDNIARVIAEELRITHPKGVIVENRAGAGGRIAAEYVKRSKPDGNTILLTPTLVMTIYPHVYSQLGFNPLTDFKPIGGVASMDYAITVGPAVPPSVKTLTDLVEWCRADPARALYGVPAMGSPMHFLGTLLAKATGVPFKPIPYKGGAQLIQDLVGGQIPIAIDPLPNAIQYHQSGRLRILASTGRERSSLVRDVPTVGELKLENLVVREFFGLYAPAQTPTARLQTLQKEVLAASLRAKERLTAIQIDPESMGYEALASFTRDEWTRWKEIVQASGFKVEE